VHIPVNGLFRYVAKHIDLEEKKLLERPRAFYLQEGVSIPVGQYKYGTRAYYP